jgi:hypothetical protein
MLSRNSAQGKPYKLIRVRIETYLSVWGFPLKTRRPSDAISNVTIVPISVYHGQATFPDLLTKIITIREAIIPVITGR